MKRLISILLALAMVFALAACGAAPEEEENQVMTDEEIADKTQQAAEVAVDAGRKSTVDSDERIDSIKVIINTMPNSLSAFYGLDAPTTFINSVIYETLLWRSGVTEYSPRLAKNWYYETDAEDSVIFELYDNITDWNGNKIEASDVVFSYDGIAASGRAANFSYYDHAEVVDPLTVRIVLKSKIEDLVSFAAMFSDVWIISEASYDEATASTNPVGTGPYKIKEFVTDAYIILEANDDYWQKDDIQPWAAQNAQEIRIDFINDSSQALIAFTSGETVFLDIGARDLDDFLNGQYAGKYTITQRLSTDAFGLAPNCHESSLMSDENLRMAVFYALDSQDFIDAAGANTFRACTTLVSPAIADYDESWDTIESYTTTQDLELAKEYLEKSSYNGETLTIMTKQFPLELNTIAQVTEQALKQIGINCEIKQYEHAVMLEQMQDPTTFDLYTSSGRESFNSITNIDKTLDVGYGSVAGYSTNFVQDPEMQSLIDAANNVDTYSAETTRAVMEYALDHAYLYSIMYGCQFGAFAENVAQIYQTIAGETMYNACEYYLD